MQPGSSGVWRSDGVSLTSLPAEASCSATLMEMQTLSPMSHNGCPSAIKRWEMKNVPGSAINPVDLSVGSSALFSLELSQLLILQAEREDTSIAQLKGRKHCYFPCLEWVTSDEQGTRSNLKVKLGKHMFLVSQCVKCCLEERTKLSSAWAVCGLLPLED